MDQDPRATAITHRKALLSTLWVFVVLNYLYGDLAMMIFHPAMYQRVVARMAAGLVLGAAVFMELAILMVVLSRVLGYHANRWANIMVGGVFTVFALATLRAGSAPAFYVFLAIVEIVSTSFIVGYAWTWPAATVRPSDSGA